MHWLAPSPPHWHGLSPGIFFGHIHPVFAAISAVVCLAPGLPSHGKQAVGLMVGVATGIIVGEAALWLPDAYPLLRIGFATFSAIAIAALYGLGAVVPIQAGVSAVLMLAVGPESAGVVRMLDVVVGSCSG
jgi:Predicted membrane protein